MASNHTHTVLYTGVTNNLKRRIYEHRHLIGSSFTTKYKVSKLLYYESFSDVRMAIQREKQLKAGSRKKTVLLIERMNPEWKDLYESIT